MAKLIDATPPNTGVPIHRNNVVVDRNQVNMTIHTINQLIRSDKFTFFPTDYNYMGTPLSHFELEVQAALQTFRNAGWTVIRYESTPNTPYYEFR